MLVADKILTNEEKRVISYSGNGNPTNPSEVNHKTPLSELYLNWTEKELPERTRTKHVHRLHPYLGKYIPQLVEIFLRKYFKPGQTVLDPFAGSGTTLVQANELGINSIGYDVSQFNTILIKAKTAKYNIKKVSAEILDILLKVQEATQSINIGLFSQVPSQPKKLTDNEYLKLWFAEQALFELLTFKNLIGNYEYQDLLKIILSRSARSSRLTTHFDLDFPKEPKTEPYECYKHRRICSPTQTSFQFIRRYCLDTIKRIEEFSTLRSNATVKIHHEDSSTALIPPIQGVITSPPYVGLIDYHEQHRYSYELLDLDAPRAQEIGAANEGTSKRAKKEYQEGIIKVFDNALKSMDKGGYLIIVAGDKHNLYDEMKSELNVKEEAVVSRHVNRRTGRRSTEFYESVFIWQKK